MAIAMTEEISASLHRGLSEWWSEETEYIFQRIERWAALARGYNRLRSQRLSRGRLTMHEEQDTRWSISSNKMVIEDPNWSPRFHNLRRSHRRKSRSDENCRINCCGTLNYQSNCDVDSNCLENYRYDHSIYFKTIGDIKSSKRDLSSSNEENNDNFSHERNEWKSKSPHEIFDYFCYDKDGEADHDECDEFSKDNDAVQIRINDCPIDFADLGETEDRETQRVIHNVWPIVDLDKLSLDATNDNDSSIEQSEDIHPQDDHDISNGTSDNDDNNNCHNNESDSTEKMIQLQITQLTTNQTRLDSSIESMKPSTSPQKNHAAITRIASTRKPRRNSKKVRQPAVVGDNNVLWPSVLLNYTKNVDNSALSPHHYRAVQVK